METKGNRWCIVLAAGDGTRLSSLTTDRRGVTTPKQYCSLRGEGSLLQHALARADRLAAPERVVTVVAAHHESWWRRDLKSRDASGILVQPANRGTAPGIVLPLLEVLARDPQARVVVLPSDHFVRDEKTLERATRRALAAVDRGRAEVVLLGMTPDTAVDDYGWILPEGGREGQLQGIASFVEKPPAHVAHRLMRAGGVWNSFILAAKASALLALVRRRLPALVRLMEGAAQGDPVQRDRALDVLYAVIPPADFSRDVMQGSVDAVHVMCVPECGWTDLGTPERVARCLEEMHLPRAGAPSRAAAPPAASRELLWNGMVLLSGAV